MKAVYLAGPDVFHKEAPVLAEKHKALCRLYGFEPHHPFDQPIPTAGNIFQTNIDLIRRADAVVANLNPFRGTEVDSGTAFEVGFAIALGKPVVGYIGKAETQMQRIQRLYGEITYFEGEGLWRDREGNMVEDLGHPVNLMLAESCTIVIGDLEDALAKLCGLGLTDSMII
ncbi:nucleoside 2-deoxyribosyltransferase [Propionivibrio limicola]|uniref:nucleoside 2-deoxyribosyltransferase n=1 Tax=Propionivibrio limicola TaxID=167645 RepID=UPI0012918F02|nr:nucleoside 2-deoxyribosyltransferase [Propionivibrio limicola]